MSDDRRRRSVLDGEAFLIGDTVLDSCGRDCGIVAAVVSQVDMSELDGWHDRGYRSFWDGYSHVVHK